MNSEKSFKMGVATIHIHNVAIKHFEDAFFLAKQEAKDSIKESYESGYNAAKEENEWRTFETVPDLGRLIITKCGYWGNTTYNVAVYESNDYLDRYLRCKYEWKYID